MKMRLSDSTVYSEGPALRRLGQNFLVDKASRDLLLDCSDLQRSDVVLEVGPGTGFLTGELVARAGKVAVVEKDSRLVKLLRRKYRGNRRLRIIEGDILKTRLPRFNKVVCSPPYYISSPLVLLLISKKFRKAVLTLQKEFAERLAAKPGSRDYGRISVMVQHRASVKIAGTIRRDAFRPVPKVDSAVVVIQRRKPEVQVKSERVFSDMVRFLFTQRRKRARKVFRQFLKTLKGNDGAPDETWRCIPDVRVFQLTVSDFERISNEICKMKK